MSTRRRLAPVVTAYPIDAVLNVEQLATALQISSRTVERLDLPTVFLGTRTKRYIWRQVLAALEAKASAA